MKKQPRETKTGTEKRKRILLVDDHPMTRHGVSHLLNREPDLKVCGEVENAQLALATVKTLKPDLVLTDLTMPGKSGLDFLKDMTVLHPGVPVLVLSMHDESIYAERVLRAGAHGYLMKSEGGDKLIGAVRQVLQGGIYVSSGVSANLLNLLTGRATRQSDATMTRLTDRELEVFQLIGQGLSTSDIGKRLHISGKTVETHRIHLKEKLKLKTRSELATHAIRWAVANQLI